MSISHANIDVYAKGQTLINSGCRSQWNRFESSLPVDDAFWASAGSSFDYFRNSTLVRKSKLLEI